MVKLRIGRKAREVKRREGEATQAYTIDEEMRHRILSLRAQYKILETYPVNDPWARIHILEHRDTGELEYYVDEIPLSNEEKRVYKRVESLLFWELEPAPPDVDPREHFKEQATKILSRFRIRFGATIHPGISWRKIEYYLLRDTIGYGVIDPLMRDLNVEDISCDGVGKHVYVWHQRYESLKTNIVFKRESELDSLVLKLAHRAGKHVSVAFPIVDAILPEGHRLAATYKKEVSTSGSTFTIRKFKETPLSIIDLIRGRTLSPRLGAYFWLAMEHNMTGMIMGVTGSGKSVSGKSMVLVRIGGRIVNTTIEDLWDTLTRHERPLGSKGYEMIVWPEIEIRSFNLNRGIVVWRRPAYLIRHLNDKQMYRITTRSGKYVDVTEDHSLIIYDPKTRRFHKTKPSADLRGKHVILLASGNGYSRAAKSSMPVFKLPETGSQSLMLVNPYTSKDLQAEAFTSYTLDVIIDVRKIDCSSCGYVYDFEVPETHNFEANGIIVHNTTTLNALATLLRPTIKVVTIEDTPELKLTLENWVQLVARPSYGFVRGVSEITLYDLVKVSLRYRPDVLIVGEVRGEEAKVLFQAIATGHGGISTIHAEDIDSMVKRLMSPPMDIPSGYIPLIDFALAIRRVKIINPDGSYRIARVITDVWEIHDVNEYFTVARWDPVTRKHEMDLEGSMVLGKISKLTGRSMTDLIEDISRRELVLRWMAIEGLRDYREVGKVIGEYYRRPNVVTKRAIAKIKELERFD